VTGRPAPEEIAELFEQYHKTKRRRTRNQLVELHIGFAQHVANRYQNRGVAPDDLRQTALLALVKAVDRYDPTVGAAFTSFAGRTIEGEIKRHFRDKTWAVRVPRSAKEMHLNVRRANDELSTQLGRSPSVAEVAAHLEVDRDQVVRALAAAAAFSTTSLDASPGDDTVAADRSARLAKDDARLQLTEDRVLIERLITELGDREKEIVRLRFFDELTQGEIADRVGVSQMHVSRLIRRALTAMKASAGNIDQ
jgi:RNA polymerase sigma-B factor